MSVLVEMLAYVGVPGAAGKGFVVNVLQVRESVKILEPVGSRAEDVQ